MLELIEFCKKYSKYRMSFYGGYTEGINVYIIKLKWEIKDNHYQNDLIISKAELTYIKIDPEQFLGIRIHGFIEETEQYIKNIEGTDS